MSTAALSRSAIRPEHPLAVRAVRHHRHRAPLLRPFVTAARRTECVEYVVAEVELNDGTIGQGSAAETVAVTGEDAASIAAALGGPLRAAVEGRRGTLRELTRAVAGAAPGASSARAALDVALHDAWARRLDRPLELWMPRRPQLQTNSPVRGLLTTNHHTPLSRGVATTN